MEKISMAIACPLCGKKAVMLNLMEEVPHFGELLISSLVCNSCNFKMNDVMPVQFNEPVQYTFKVRDSKGLETKIAKSSSATIEMPELGIKIEPGTFSEGYFSNLEGVLDRAEQAVKAAAFNAKGKEKAAAESELELIKKAREGEKHFTIILSDPFGNSALIGRGVKKRRFGKKEIEKLKKSAIIL